ncbi:MAG TPA: extracellular solute-binding protein [Gemmataceae bacterium]|nr:extracellular solute-binding protein [Gemmataceae bacterium]
MQHFESANPRTRRIGLFSATGLAAAALSIASLGVGGCDPGATIADKKEKPFAGVALKVRCPDRAFADAITPIAKTWAARTGATVVWVPPNDPDPDVLVLPAAEIGLWAERDELLPVPPAIKEAAHPYQWQTVLPVYRGEQLAGWGRQIYALPLVGDGHVIVYRADRFADPVVVAEFQKEVKRKLDVPNTWEDYAEVAAFFSRLDKKPALPLPDDPARLADLFFRVAACYDRPALGEDTVGGPANAKNPAPAQDVLAFQFHTDSGKPRLSAAGFKAAAEWLAGLKARGAIPEGGSADPVAALADGRAVMAVVSLAELIRLPRENGQVPARFAVAPLPGTRRYFDASGKEVSSDSNYVPYFSGGRFGIVRKGCAQPDAAFDLLAEIGGPGRSLELISTPGLGAGPFRDNHLDQDRLLIWLGYGFDEDRSKALQESLKGYIRRAVRNPVYGLRGPDQEKLTAALAVELKAIASGTVPPEPGLERAVKAWDELSAGVPPERLIQWRRRAVGLS